MKTILWQALLGWDIYFSVKVKPQYKRKIVFGTD